ncbi:MAG: c-type cytochrome [Holosporales bacterium]|jgi:cytochrome c
MASMELNKIAAAVLIAGITILGTKIFAHYAFNPPEHGDAHKGHAYKIAEGVTPAATDAAPAAAVVVPPIAPLMASASVEEGMKSAKKCAACHSFDKGGPNKVGPNMWNVVGSKHGHTEGYSYSAALLAKPGIWDYEGLNQFLLAPKTYIPGTKMAFAGIKDDKERANLIAYLRSLSDNPVPLP